MKYLLPLLVLIMVLASGCDERRVPPVNLPPIQSFNVSDGAYIEIYTFGNNTCYRLGNHINHEVGFSCVRSIK